MDNKSFSSCDRGIKEAVCIDTNRVYDSCADKDCLSDLRLIFTDRAQSIIDNASSIRVRGAEVVSTKIIVDPVQFNRGCYSVDITYFFRVYVDVCVCGAPAQTVSGLTTFSKKCILYGSEGNVKVFTSDAENESCGRLPGYNSTAPRAKVQVVDPITLDARLVRKCDCPCNCALPECGIPDCICEMFDGDFVSGSGENAVVVTLGLFSIVQLERDVQMLIPAYDFCMPSKECTVDSPDPCDTFRKIHFPVEEFFPPQCKADLKK